jgi:hypothetical protein
MLLEYSSLSASVKKVELLLGFAIRTTKDLAKRHSSRINAVIERNRAILSSPSSVSLFLLLFREHEHEANKTEQLNKSKKEKNKRNAYIPAPVRCSYR